MNEPETSAAAETTEISKTREILPLLQRAAIPVLLFALTLAVFWPATRCGFISFDDPYYVSSNPHVRSGLRPANVAWAFTTTQTANWHPVTWMSHMLDVSFFGMRPAWHHLVNVVIHGLNSVLVFLLLRRMTGGDLTQRRKDAIPIGSGSPDAGSETGAPTAERELGAPIKQSGEAANVQHSTFNIQHSIGAGSETGAPTAEQELGAPMKQSGEAANIQHSIDAGSETGAPTAERELGAPMKQSGEVANIQHSTFNIQHSIDAGSETGAPGAQWRCAFVAALFALHPVHVESVAWIAERKDVLSTFFGLVTLLFYVKYALDRKSQRTEDGGQRPEDGGKRTEDGGRPASGFPPSLRSGAASWHLASGSYVWALVFFTLGLMSKPMLVTLPFVMLLLDYWPLGRFRISDFGLRKPEDGSPRTEDGGQKAEVSGQWSVVSRLGVLAALREKIPFFVLSAVFCVITFIAQRAGGAVVAMGKIPLGMRIENVFVSYARYLGKLFWPAHLALPYPYPNEWPWWFVVFGMVLTVGVCLAALMLSRRWPFVGVGWFWFFGMLIPVIGLVQVGNQSLADRYLYLPSIGIFIVVSWLMADFGWRNAEARLGRVGLTQRRKDAKGAWSETGAPTSETETSNIEHRTPNIEGAGIGAQETNIQHLSHAGSETGAPESGGAAAPPYRAGRPYRSVACGVAALAVLLLCAWDTRKQLSYWQDSVSLFAHTVQVTKNNSIAIDSLGASLFERGKAEEALECYNLALKIHARDPLALDGIGCYWFSKGEPDKAIEYFKRVLAVSTNQPLTYFNLGSALAQQGHFDEAIPNFQSAMRLQPDDPDAPYLLGNVYYMKQQYEQAAACYVQAVRLRPDYVAARRGYGASLMMLGRMEEAGVEFTQILRMMPGDPDTNLMLARIHAKLGHVWEAKVHLSEVLRARPGDPEATKLLKELGQ